MTIMLKKCSDNSYVFSLDVVNLVLLIDMFSKMKQWLLLEGDKIIGVSGRRISDDIKVTSRTTKFAKFIIE